MEASSRAKALYGNARTSVKSNSQIEYQAFARVTQDIKTFANSGPEKFASLVSALHQNLRLWTIIASDVAANGNGLPQQLRAQLLYLAEFTMVHTRKVLKGEAEPEALIDINTAVMKGLRQQEEAAKCPA